jgi:hypothetical protein
LGDFSKDVILIATLDTDRNGAHNDRLVDAARKLVLVFSDFMRLADPETNEVSI